MRKNSFLVLLIMVAFLFAGFLVKSTAAADDPVSTLKGSKTPVHLHSLAGSPAGGDTLVDTLLSMMNTWWQSIYPPNTYNAIWKVRDERYVPRLSKDDKLGLRYYSSYPPGTAGDSLWVNVSKVTLTLLLTRTTLPNDTLWVEFTGGGDSLSPDSLNRALTDPVNTWWHEVRPTWCNYYQITAINATPLQRSRNITMGGAIWHVEAVAIDIEVHSIPDPAVPTMTQWGVIILVVLLIGSAVFIGLKRRKVAVPA